MSEPAVKFDNIIDDRKREIYYGKIVMMASGSLTHAYVMKKIFSNFDRHFDGTDCEAYMNNVDVILADDCTLVPDVLVVCKRVTIDPDKGVMGAPNLVVEVLSPSTMLRDKTEKKDIYEKNGVKEYWLVDTKGMYIEIYALNESGRFDLVNLCQYYTEKDIAGMTYKEKEKVIHAFTPHTFPDIAFSLSNIFKGAPR